MAIAISDSVTVSIAALSSGTFRRMFLVSLVLTSTCAGSTVECRGTSRMSSKVSAVRRPASSDLLMASLVCVGVMDVLSPVALLEFFTAATPARIVAANLRLVPLHRLDHIVAADARGPALLREVVRRTAAAARQAG